PPFASAELYDPGSGTWSRTGSLVVGRFNHVAIPLSNGTVLVAGGLDQTVTALASAELYDPGTGAWTATASMHIPRNFNGVEQDNTAIRLQNGDVLVAGGAD